MSSALSFEAHEWTRFSVPHALRLIGEHQHLLGAGSISLASTLRLRVEAEETPGEFSLRFGSGARGEGAPPLSGSPLIAEFAVRWENAIEEVIVEDGSLLESLGIYVDFGPLWGVCGQEAMLAAPALAVGLAVAVTAHRGEGRALTEVGLAELASGLRHAIEPKGTGSPDRFYSDALLGIVGGVGYAEPGGRRLNVQQLLPPGSFLLALAPGVEAMTGEPEREAAARRALKAAHQAGADIMAQGDEGVAALFELAGNALSQEQTGMLYGLLRVRQMAEEFLEHLGEPFVDNDRMAEICDEESAILADYFAFPAAAYEGISGAAAEMGALGVKLMWAFGSYPAALIIAPGRRGEVVRALSRKFQDTHFLTVDMDPTGLIAGEGDEPESVPTR